MIASGLCEPHQIFLIDFIVISVLDYMSIKDYQLIFRCFECKQSYKKDLNKDLFKRFANIYEFRNEDIHKFILLLRKEIYLYEYMDSWEIFDET